MSDTWSGSSSTAWFTAGNWSTGAVPAISATGTESIVINGSSGNQPVIPYNQNVITVIETVITSGTTYTALSETQIGGEQITLTNGANLTVQGLAMGVFYGNADTITATGGTMTGLHGALSTTPSFDSHMSVVVLGTDTLTVETINENFGLITIGSGDTLTLNNTYAASANPQALHGLINYGLITVSAGGDLNITAGGTVGTGTVANFYNAGWIEVSGGTLSISSSVLDGADTASSATTADGYIEISNSGNVILSNTVASTEQITFTDTTANTLQITAGTLFSGTVNNFGPSDTIDVNGFTTTSNATITTVGGVTELITTNGSVVTTITLTGTTSSNITTGTNASGQEYIVSGGSTVSSGTTYAGGTDTLASTSGGTLANNGTVVVTGAGTDLVVTSSLTGTGGFFIDNGATLSLDNSTGNDVGQTAQFGTHGSGTNPNVLLVNDDSQGFGGKVTGFGINDEIVLGPNVLTQPSAGTGIYLSYNTGTGVLTVDDTNSSTGSIVSATQITVSGTPALTTAAFTTLNSANGVIVELASSLADQSFNFSIASGTSGAFETAANFTGGVAPGDSLVSGETATIASGTASISGSALVNAGSIAIASGAALLDNGPLTGGGTLAVLTGGSATLGGSVALGAILDSGTLALSGSAPVSAINMEGNGANSIVDFTGTSTGAVLTNFGLSDEIALGTTALPIGTGTSLTYSTATGVLTVNETNASGTIIGTDHVTVSGTAAGALSTASFIALNGSTGTDIFLNDNLNFVFSHTGNGAGAFETGTNFTGGVSPGDTLYVGENVTIQTGIATVATAGLVDNGNITINSTLGDHGTLSGIGTIITSTAGKLYLYNGGSVGSIIDNKAVYLSGGTLAAPVTVATGADLYITGASDVTGAISGAGGVQVSNILTTLAGGASVATIQDNGTIDLAGSFSSAFNITGGAGTLAVQAGSSATLTGAVAVTGIYDSGTLAIGSAAAITAVNMEGNGANSVVDFTGTNTATPLTNFGTSDDIILGTSALAALPAGDGLVLSYATATGILTVSETNASGTVVATDNVTVAGAASLTTGSFVVLDNAKGLNIELAPTASTTYAFSTTGTGSFETGTNFAGGTAPGDILSGFETVAITAGIASVSSTGVADNGLLQVKNGAAFTDAGSLSGTGTLAIAAGGTATLGSSATLGAILNSGTVDVTGNGPITAINMEGNGANSVAEFSGTAIPSLYNFGTTDELVANGLVVPTGDGLVLSYSTTSGVLTANVTSSTGGVLYTGTATITNGTAPGITGNNLTAGSFVALATANGTIIELAPTTATSYAFSTTGTGAFESGANFTGGTAPGDVLTSLESVTIAAGIASVSTGGVTDNGTLIVANGAAFTDAGSLKGTGTLAVLTGGTATLAGGTSLASIQDHGTIALTGASGVSSINMEGNAANSVVDFTGTSAATPLTNLGTTDEIILGTGVLTAPIPGTSGVLLNYATGTGILTVEDTNNSTGSIISTANVTVAGAASLTTASLVALAGTKGEVIELASNLTSQSFVFSASSTGSFEAPANYAGGIAPGDAIVTGENVTIAAGTASVSAAGVSDAGLITVASGAALLDAGSLTGTGTLSVAAGGAATLGGSASLGAVLDYGTINITGTATDSAINMEGNGANSFVDLTGASNATSLFNFGNGDSIAIGTAALSLSGASDALSLSYNSTTDVITITDATTGKTVTEHLTLATGDLPVNLHVTEINGSGSLRQTEITLCFYPGTALATPDGEILVENIQDGTMLLTTNGAMPVRWVGQSHIHTRFADPLRSLPIRIRQGALGEGLPARDLLLSPDHAIHLDGVLIQAGALVNGLSIVREHDVPEQFTYFHVELASHELLLAEGVEAESFVDNVDRMHFHNWDARIAPTTMIEEMDLPRAKAARQVPPSIRQRLHIGRAAVA